MIQDTIAAIATAVGEGGIGIIRVSGAEAITVVDKLFLGSNGRRIKNLSAFQAAYGFIVEPQTAQRIDEVLVLVMRAPHSYTCEDVVEIHCHGGHVALRQVLLLVLTQGCRLAEAGEFTKRAFLNGRLDLSQAEAIIDVIRAKTEIGLDLAVKQLSGSLASKIKEIQRLLLNIIAQLEVAIDFSDEEVGNLQLSAITTSIVAARTEIESLLLRAASGKILREGLKTVIVGRPNVGKSSLLNVLTGYDRAIVTDIPGTTRDTIEEYITIAGVPLCLIDTAGIRLTTDQLEQLGVERTKQAVQEAGLIILVLDTSSKLMPEDQIILSNLPDIPLIILLNKCDLPELWVVADLPLTKAPVAVVKFSTKTAVGLDELSSAIADCAYGSNEPMQDIMVSNIRHISALQNAHQHLVAAAAAAHAGLPEDCIVIDVRNAWESLGLITGDAIADNIIDEIFSQFCIGK